MRIDRKDSISEALPGHVGKECDQTHFGGVGVPTLGEMVNSRPSRRSEIVTACQTWPSIGVVNLQL